MMQESAVLIVLFDEDVDVGSFTDSGTSVIKAMAVRARPEALGLYLWEVNSHSNT